MGRKKLTEPSEIHKRIIELAMKEPDLKVNFMPGIGKAVAKVIGRKSPFTRQYVEQVLIRWIGWNGWQGYNVNRPTVNMTKRIEAYEKGASSQVLGYGGYKYLSMRKVERRGHKAKILKATNLAEQRSKQWLSGMSIKDCAKAWKMNFVAAGVYIVKHRKSSPLLFPIRRKFKNR